MVTSPPAYTAADLKPASAVLLPTVVLYENVSPGIITIPSILEEASLILVVLLTFLVLYEVENVANRSGNASVPIWLVVILGFIIFKGIT